jgi:hypothetical protein
MTADVFTVARGESEFRRLSDNERELAGLM